MKREAMKPDSRQALLSSDGDAFGVAGVVLVVDPEDATGLGALEESALSFEDAWESNSDDAEGEPA
jgi:hypothetical protein